MPKGPRGERRPADVIGAAVKVGRIAVGDIDDDIDANTKDPKAKALGAKGGAARAAKLSDKRKAEIAKKAAKARWKRHKA